LQPELHPKGAGNFYFAGIRDFRGEGDLNPHAFGKLVVAQPEFNQCMIKKAAEYISRDFTSEDLHEIAQNIESSNPTFKEIYLAAMNKFLLLETKTALTAKDAI